MSPFAHSHRTSPRLDTSILPVLMSRNSHEAGTRSDMAHGERVAAHVSAIADGSMVSGFDANRRRECRVASGPGSTPGEEARTRMLRFALNRIFWFIPTLLAMAAVTFVIMQLTPGSPFDVSDKQRPEDIARLEALYGLDKPLPEQFARYVWNALHLDFGISYHARPQTVNDIISRTFPISLHLGADGHALRRRRRDDARHSGGRQPERLARLLFRHAGGAVLQHAQLRHGVPAHPPVCRLATRSAASISGSASVAGNARRTGFCRRSRLARRRWRRWRDTRARA